MALHQLIYVSQATKPMSSGELFDLVEVSKRNNHPHDITGQLLYNSGVFMQVLEGEKDEIVKLYERIKLDERHHDVEVLYLEPANYRIFDGWSMNMFNLDVDTPSQANTLRAIIKNATNHLQEVRLSAPLQLLRVFTAPPSIHS